LTNQFALTIKKQQDLNNSFSFSSSDFFKDEEKKIDKKNNKKLKILRSKTLPPLDYEFQEFQENLESKDQYKKPKASDEITGLKKRAKEFIDIAAMNSSNDYSRCSKILGTANYISPEIINMRPTHGEEDFWALGVIIFYIYTKKLPFYSENVEDIFDNIVNNNIDWDSLEKTNINSNLLLLVKGLLNEDFDERIKNLDDIKENAFFKGINVINHNYKDFDWLNCNKKNSILKSYAMENLRELQKKIQFEKSKKELISNMEIPSYGNSTILATVKIDNLDSTNKSIVFKDLRDLKLKLMPELGDEINK